MATEKDLEMQELRRICADLEKQHLRNTAEIELKEQQIQTQCREAREMRKKIADLETENRLQHGQIVRLRRQIEAMEEGQG